MRDTNLYVKHLNNPSDKKDYSLKALGGHTEEERFNVIVEQLRKLPKTASVLLLGRYRSDINLMIRCDQSVCSPSTKALEIFVFSKNRIWIFVSMTLMLPKDCNATSYFCSAVPAD